MTYKDLKPLYQLLSKPLVMKYLEPPFSYEQAEKFLLEQGLSYKPRIYAVEKNRNFIGYVIYHDYDDVSIEIGWVLDSSYWGKGIATFLTEQMIDKAKQSGKHIVIECVPEQVSSIRIAERYGFKYQRKQDGLMIFYL